MHESAYDFLTPATAMVFCDQPVVSLSPWLARAHAGAVRSGRRFVVLTPSASSITLPLSAMLDGQSAAWLATSSDGGFYDAVTGRRQVWDGAELRPGDGVAAEFLSAERVESAYFHIRASVFHPASLATQAGAFTSRVFEAATGSAPVGWGLYEPVSELWDAAAFSEHCYRRSPGTTRAVVTGSAPGRAGGPATAAGSVAVVTVERTRSGVVETVELLAEAEAPLTDAGLDAFLEAMHGARSRTAVLAYGLGYRDLARPARFTGTAVPGCALFGPEALAGRSAQSALALAGSRAGLLGTAPAQSLGVRYAPEPVAGEPHPLEAYGQLLLELGGSPGSSA
ncbi:DUF6177 family protein [Arthrobacter caoxuetaonis]|uniref:DUF6177 family protein n=1 Tax=Arthrobacter caoxuetaonis TaxID=2886935 RepID=A0A9X1MCU1_9MICC|nr:DUF6177 family protein [Arthrobacter caoxuetaonis]MCC3297181.1 DUF6177 family protein [Arthrobacter caoxuetaonis]USQ58259.1 DUF6177 family protein [Arthrobacter caoxuetaonis]